MTLCFALLLPFFPALRAQTKSDSMMIDGKAFTLHKVAKGETLYGICNKYKVDMTEVVVVNKMGNNGYSLAEGEVLTIPLYAKKALAEAKEVKLAEDGYITHVVKQGETLFSISRNYNGITPQMLRDKNKLKSDTLRINQQLLIPQQIIPGVLYKPNAGDAAQKSAHAEASGRDKRLMADNEKKYKASQSAAGTVEVVRGIATWQDDEIEENQKNFYALHKYAPIGSVLKVRNLMNNREAYVKVIGKLPDIEINRNVAIMVSAATARQLRVFDAKFLVEITLPATEKGADQSRK
jgi:LysM repeat protein